MGYVDLVRPPTTWCVFSLWEVLLDLGKLLFKNFTFYPWFHTFCGFTVFIQKAWEGYITYSQLYTY